MELMYSATTINTVHHRLRFLRESRKLTLLDVEKLSGGQISAVALGSYERGDRALNVAKLINLAEVYQLPVTEFFADKTDRVEPHRITIDIRAIIKSERSEAVKLIAVLRAIAQRRGDWNGEIISLRATDIDNLSIFTGLSTAQVAQLIREFGITRSK